MARRRRAPDASLGPGLTPSLFLALGSAIAVATVVAYWPSLDNALTNWDDPEYVLHNPFIRELSFESLRTLFTSYYKGNYHPLAMLSLAIDHAIGGSEPAVYHRTSLALHVLVTLLVLALAHGLLRERATAVFVALAFGLHPLHVESVAWASARKDLVFALFFFLSLLAYLRHCREQPRRPGLAFGLALGLFVLSLLSKGQAVALAPTLVAIDWLEGRRLLERRVVLEKLPFFALALGFGALAIVAQGESGGQLEGTYVWSLGQRFVFASTGYVQYWLLALAPHELTAYYPYPHPREVADGLPWRYLVAVPVALAWVGVFAWCLRRARRVAFGIAFFTLNIVFVLQLLPIGNVIMADRYTYVASFGIFFGVGACLDRAQRAWPSARIAVAVAALAWLLVLAGTTWRQCDVWQSSETLWDDVLGKHPHAAAGLLNRAYMRFEAGDLAGAREDLDVMIDRWPEDSKAYGHRAVVRYRTGDVTGGLADLGRAIRLAPSAGLYSNRGGMKVGNGDLRGALADFTKAVELSPDDATARSKRGWTRAQLGDARGALEDYLAVQELAPRWAEGHFGAGLAYGRLGQLERSGQSFDRAVALDPSHAEAWLRRAEVLQAVGRTDDACRDLARAVQLGIDARGSALAEACSD